MGLYDDSLSIYESILSIVSPQDGQVQDKIKQNEAFTDVQMIHIRDVGRNSTEKEFAVKFKFQGVR